MLKKILIGLLITLVLLVGAVIAIPYFFKDEIVVKIKEVVNENVNAQVDFGDFDLSILSTFPNFLFEIHEVKVIGKGAFDKDTIIYIKDLNLELDINSVMDGKKYKVNSFDIDGLVLNALWTKENAFSLDIMKPSPEDTTTEESGDPFSTVVEEYSIKNARIVYDDPTIPYRMELINMNHSGKYELNGDEHIMKTLTDVDALSMDFDGTKMMNKVKSNIVADVIMDLANWKFTFKENVFKLNNLTLGLDGWLTMPDEGFGMDLKFNQKNAEFKDLFSMLPSDVTADLADVKTTGKFEFNGFAKGMFISEKEKYPAFGFNLKVQDASFQYPDLPKSVKNIQLDLKVENPDGDLDHTKTDINKFHMEMGGNPVDIKLQLRTPISDAYIAGNIKADLNLAVIGEVMPLDKGEEYHGKVKADINLKGNYSSIEKEEYEKFDANGSLDMTDLIYKTADMPTVLISKANLLFTPQTLDLTAFESKIGNSDLSAHGKIENYLAYVFKDETIKGAFNISSGFFDVNQFMSDDTTVAATTADTAASEGAIEIPKNVDFVLTSDLKKIKYDTYDIQNFAGQLVMKDGVLKFENNTFKLLDADFKLSGQYHAHDIKKPYSNLQFEVKNLDIPKAYANFNTIKKLAPICENTEGKLNLGLDVETYFTAAMDVDYNTITGKGNLFIQNAKIKDSKFTKGLADVIKSDKFKSFELKDLKIYFFITDGKVSLEPFDIKMSKSKAKVSGWNSVDMKMDYTMATSIHKDEFGGAANQQAQQLLSIVNQKTGASVVLPEFINADIKITGDVTNPKFSIHPTGASGGDNGKSAVDQAKAELEKRAREEAEKLKQKVEEEARKKADELKQQGEAELQKQKQAAEEKAKQEIEKAKKEAELKAKQEAEKKAKDALNKIGF